MPRPRKNDPSTLLAPLVRQFASELAAIVERFTSERITQAIDNNRKPAARRTRGRVGHVQKLCYFPGCKNVAAPRFGMFCAAIHKDLPPRTKQKYRAARTAAVA